MSTTGDGLGLDAELSKISRSDTKLQASQKGNFFWRGDCVARLGSNQPRLSVSLSISKARKVIQCVRLLLSRSVPDRLLCRADRDPSNIFLLFGRMGLRISDELPEPETARHKRASKPYIFLHTI